MKKRGINQKRGISPLIATVLILGFTIALAAIIMNWAGVFTKKMTEGTEETANVQIICATEVIFDLESVCVDTNDYKLLVSNDGARDIDSFIIRYYAGADTVEQQTHTFTGGLAQFAIESALSGGGDPTLTTTAGAGTTKIDNVNKIEMIPVATIGGKSTTCASNVDSYGSEVSMAFEPC
ncbi:MAG: hypothetical protein ISS23_00805 [Nanoarchaeota archaeon]|nr:hypothetical protein [Nanoarchaeota archaeon]